MLPFLIACAPDAPLGDSPGAANDSADSATPAGSDSGDSRDSNDSDSGSESGGDSGVSETSDADGDGLPDADELALASEYLPFLSLSPDDACPTMGIVFRASPHPLDPTRLHVIYDLLYDNDCGAGGHVGDDEVFAITLDPSRPAPDGILAVIAIAHQDTLCESVTECGSGGGLAACTTELRDGAAFPVVFASTDKHGNYVDEGSCDGSCFYTNWCDASATEPAPMLVNAGEAALPLTRNLTEAGLITAENGWQNAELFDYDPWGGAEFGGAGIVATDLVDPAFDTPVW